MTNSTDEGLLVEAGMGLLVVVSVRPLEFQERTHPAFRDFSEGWVLIRHLLFDRLSFRQCEDVIALCLLWRLGGL